MQSTQGSWNHSGDPHNQHHSRIQYALFGANGDNGVVGTTAQLKKDVAELQEFRRTINVILITLRWAGLCVGFLLTIGLPPEFWTALNGWLGVAKAVGAAV